MTAPESTATAAVRADGSVIDLRVGEPERTAARDVLDEHLGAERLDDTEYELRCAAIEAAATRSELMRVFDDLPEPHPQLPSLTRARDEDDDLSALGWAVALLLGLGLPVAVVLGITNGAWWSLAVPVGVGVVMVYVEHLLNRGREARRARDAIRAAAISRDPERTAPSTETPRTA